MKTRKLKSHPNEDPILLKNLEEVITNIMMKQTKHIKEKKSAALKLDETVLTAELLNPFSNYAWIVEAGVTMIRDGKTPGKHTVAFLEHLKIIKS